MPTLTIQEVADELKVHSRTVMRWIAEGKINVIHLGRLVRIEQSELDRIKREGIPRDRKGR